MFSFPAITFTRILIRFSTFKNMYLSGNNRERYSRVFLGYIVHNVFLFLSILRMCQGAIVIRSRRAPVEIRFMACTGFLDSRFLGGIIRIRIRVMGLLGGFSLGRLFGLWGTLFFLGGVGDQVLSDSLSGDGTDTFFFFLGNPEG